MFKHPVTLEGQVVKLEPLHESHFDALMRVAQQSPDDFRFTSTPISEAQKKTYFEYAFSVRDALTAYPWVMIDKKTNAVAGTTRLYDANWNYRHCLLGYTWFAKHLFGTAFNVESKYLMLKYAFEELNLIRVQMNSDSRNERSHKAIKALGAVYEGTLRSSQVNKDGFVRDNAIFSLIAEDWLKVKPFLEKRIERKLARS